MYVCSVDIARDDFVDEVCVCVCIYIYAYVYVYTYICMYTA